MDAMTADGPPANGITVDVTVGPSRTSAATAARTRTKARRLIEELTPRLDALTDDELTQLLLIVFDAVADRAQMYEEGREP